MLASLGVLITGMVVLIFDVVVDRPLALVVGAGTAAVLAALLVVLPGRLTSER